MGKKETLKTVYEIIDTATKYITKAEWSVRKRCMIEGCRYGLGLPDEIPQKHCIYCGMERIDYDTDVIKPLQDLLNKTPTTKEQNE